jgi:hypothetical protein
MGNTKILLSSALYLLLSLVSVGYCRSTVTSEAKCFINELSKFIGKTELTGRNDGIYVEAVLKSAGLNPKSRASYCAAFMVHGFVVCGLKPYGNVWTPSWFPKSKVVDYSQVQDSGFYFFGLYYQNLGRIGHVGYVLQKKPTYIITIEGNTSPTAAIGSEADRNGYGFWKKRRMRKGISVFSKWR